ncbi:MAG: hypothetical protein P8080_02550 [Gammaproteobacteria bacterium]
MAARSLISELKRRNVIRVAVAYAVLSWLVLQVADVLIDALDLSGDYSKFIVVLLALGLIPALVFSWVYELTPEGIRRESDIDREVSITPHTGHKLNVVIVVLLVCAIGLFIADRFLWSPGTGPAVVDNPALSAGAGSATSGAENPEPASATGSPSVAVLPFTNMSADPENEYFSDGLADTLLHMLAQSPGLRVAARTSSFRFKNQQVDVREVGDQLGVGAVLEGSIQRAGDRIRVVAQLIDTQTGFHLWSEAFDRQLDDIFRVQDEIAQQVSQALLASLVQDADGVSGTSALRDVGGTENVAAYEAFMQANQRLERRTTEDVEAAITLLELAVELDPTYGRAWARLAQAHGYRATYGAATFSEVMRASSAAAKRAVAVAPQLAEAHMALARHLLYGERDLAAALESTERALALNPNSVEALTTRSDLHGWYMEFGARLRTLLSAVERDPLDPELRRDLANAYQETGFTDEAWATLNKALELDPDSVATERELASFKLRRGDAVGAIGILRNIEKQNPELLQAKMVLAAIYAELGDPEVAVAYMREAWEIQPDRVHDDLAGLFYELGDRETALRHWRDYREYIETGGSDEDELQVVDRVEAVISEDWPRAAELLQAELESYREENDPWRALQAAALLAGIEARLGHGGRTEALMGEALELLDRAEASGYRDPNNELVRALDAAHQGDADRTARHLQAVLDADPLSPVITEFTELLPPPEILESQPVQAVFSRVRTERAEVLAQVRSAFPEAP